MELYKKYRPKTLKQLIGQDAIRSTLEKRVAEGKMPHAMLLFGPTGTGKTTIARIIKSLLECSDGDYQEINCSNFRGIDMVREIQNRAGLSPIAGDTRLWVIDECHRLTPEAQDAFLKLLEDGPKHAYFILATTDPQKLIAAVKNRCTALQTKALAEKDAKKLLSVVCAREKAQISEDIQDAIVNHAEGSARKVLVLLEQVLACGDEEEALQVLKKPQAEEEAIKIARALFNPKTTWADMASIIKGVAEDPESIRWMVLGYANALALGNKNVARAILVIEAFRDHWYDCKKSGLIASCYEVVGVKR